MPKGVGVVLKFTSHCNIKCPHSFQEPNQEVFVPKIHQTSSMFVPKLNQSNGQSLASWLATSKVLIDVNIWQKECDHLGLECVVSKGLFSFHIYFSVY